jgi:DNA polymerase I-like protein with 3'-5' exonuclease and polymerase domains
MSTIQLDNDGIPIVLTVHDSIVADGPEKQANEMADHIADVMRKVGEEWIPEVPWKVDCDMASSWAKRPSL